MVFIETSQFTQRINALVSDEDYSEFQHMLTASPEKGALMVGCGGVRKVRMAAKGKGTSGSARVIYLYIANKYHIYLSAEGKKTVRKLAEAIKHAHRS